MNNGKSPNLTDEQNDLCYEIQFAIIRAIINMNHDTMWEFKVHLPDANVTKLRVVTCNKALRIRFENTMSNLMSEAKYRKIGEKYGNY